MDYIWASDRKTINQKTQKAVHKNDITNETYPTMMPAIALPVPLLYASGCFKACLPNTIPKIETPMPHIGINHSNMKTERERASEVLANLLDVVEESVLGLWNC